MNNRPVQAIAIVLTSVLSSLAVPLSRPNRDTSTGGSSQTTSVAATISVRDFGAKGDGAFDDTAAFNKALREGCAKQRTVYFPKGTYAVHPLNTVNGCSMTLYGDGPNLSVLKLIGTGPGQHTRYPLIALTGPGRVLFIHDFGLDGQQYPASGLVVLNMEKATVRNVSVRNFGRPGHREGHTADYNGMYFHTLNNLSILNCVSQHNERDGIETQAVHYLDISNCDLSDNARLGGVAEQNVVTNADGPLEVSFTDNIANNNGSGGFDIETAKGLPAAKGYIHGNTVENGGNDQWGYGWGVVLGNNTYGEISSNTIINFAKTGEPYRSAIVAGGNSGMVTIAHNTVNGSGGDGIHINMGASKGYPANITDNTVLTSGQDGISAYNAPSSTVRGNIVGNSRKNGITMSRAPGSSITNNQLYGNGGQPVSVTSSHNVVTRPNIYSLR